MFHMRIIPSLLVSGAVLVGAGQAAAQTTPPAQEAPPQHDMASMSHSDGWMWMNDGALFATYNDQGGARGKREFKSQNWFMTMAQHKLGPGQVTFKAMLSAEVWTQTERGYSQLFQKGEVYNGLENIDYQHPHDVFMQLAAAWRVPLGSKTGLTISGGPMGEATLGPAAFMHRQSASENPTAPLTHHFLDSGHVVQGVVALSLDRGPWIAEASLFHGAEPDQNRYGVTPGKLDSWAGRVWFRPLSPAAKRLHSKAQGSPVLRRTLGHDALHRRNTPKALYRLDLGGFV
jgi:hypothetical protein